MTKPAQDKETLREAVISKIRTHFSNDIQAAIVADAAIATMFERLRTPSEGMIEAGVDRVRHFDLEPHLAEAIWQAMLTAFQQENSECPSCGGLNISCPDGCGRDPITGELNFSRLENSDAS